MRLLSLAVRDFRGIRERRVDLAGSAPDGDGVTILQGPNEIGKTSLAEALEMLFERRDSSVAEEVREAQPLGRDVGPEVEVEARCGEYRFRYRKRFLKGPETVLEVTEPVAESLTGREAHDRVGEILDRSGVDRDLWKALRVVQGSEIGQPEGLLQSPSLMDALGAGEETATGPSTEGSASGRHQVDLHGAVEEEFRRYFTLKRQEPSGELREAREELAAATAAEVELAAAMAALESDAERVTRLEADLVDLRGRLETAERAASEAAAELVAVEGLEGEVARLGKDLAERRERVDSLTEVTALRRRVADLAEQRRVATAEAEEAEAALVPAREAFKESRQVRVDAEAELERRREGLRLGESLAARRESLADLDERWGEAGKAAERLAAAEKTLADLVEIGDEAVAKLEALERERGLLVARLEAASPRLEVTARHALRLAAVNEEAVSEEAVSEAAVSEAADKPGGQSLDKLPLDLTAGERWQVQVRDPLHLSLGEVVSAESAETWVELTLTPGADAEEQRRRLAEVDEQLAGGLRELGVKSVEAARLAHRQRQRAEAARRLAASALAGVTGEAGLAGLEARRSALTTQIGELESRLDGLVAGGEAGNGQEGPLQAARAAEALARETLAAVQRRQEAAQEEGEKRSQARAKAEAMRRELEIEERGAREQRHRAAERAAGLLRRHGEEVAPEQLIAERLEPEREIKLEGSDGPMEESASARDSASGLSAASTAPARPLADPLPALLAAAEEAVVAGEEELAAARRRLGAASPEGVRRRATESTATLTAARAEQRRVEDEHLEVRTRLDSAGEQGLFERLGEARGRLAAADRAATSIEARAKAAARLYRAVEEAREAAREAYAGPLARTLEDLGRPLFGDDFRVELDEELNVARRTAFGSTLEYSRLSTGAREQLSLLLRLACAVLVAPGEGVPLLLDDVLGSTDRGRLDALGDVLTRAGELCQVIVLTCYPDRYRNVNGARRVDLT